MQFLDTDTRRQLGFDEVWAQVTPVSSLGRAYQRKTIAFGPQQGVELEEELQRVEGLCDSLRSDSKAADNLSFLLGASRDIETSLKRSMQGVTLDDMEFYEVKKLLAIAEKVQAELERRHWTFCLTEPLDQCPECREHLSLGQGRQDSFYIADAYDEELAQVRQERIRLEAAQAAFRSAVDEKTISTMGRFLSTAGEITVSSTDSKNIALLEAMPELVKVQETPYYVTFSLIENEEMCRLRTRLTEVREAEEECKQRVRVGLTSVVADHGSRLMANLEQLAYLDFLVAKAKYASMIGAVKPQLGDASTIRIHDGRHPLVEEEVTRAGYVYTPLSLEISSGVTLITGPNMGGKTASLRTVGLLVAMAQYGLLVPVRFMEFKPRKFIRAHLTAAEIPKGLSSFAGEVVFLRDVITCSRDDGLILVDEIAHGTNPVEGVGLARAIMENLSQKPSMTIITTHYPSLASVEGIRHLRVRGLDLERLEQAPGSSLQHFMDYRLEVAGAAGALKSDAIVVAQTLGLDATIITRARELLAAGISVEERDASNE